LFAFELAYPLGLLLSTLFDNKATCKAGRGSCTTVPNQIELAQTAAVADAASADEAVINEVTADELAPLNTGWRLESGGDSLKHLNSSVQIAVADSHWFMKLASFAGVGIMVQWGIWTQATGLPIW
jgi:hypothetical protein